MPAVAVVLASDVQLNVVEVLDAAGFEVDVRALDERFHLALEQPRNRLRHGRALENSFTF